MGAAQTKENHFFKNSGTSPASFYEGLEKLSTNPADPGIIHSKNEIKIVRKLAGGYVQAHPELTQQQQEDIISGGQDKDLWPMARCLSFCKMYARNEDGELNWKMGTERYREQFGKCLNQTCNPVQAKMSACLEKQYSSRPAEPGITSDDLMLLVEPGFTKDDLMLAPVKE